MVAAAKAISWVCYVGTVSATGHPHVSVIAPGFTKSTVWAGTRRSTKKLANLTQNPRTSLYWPVDTGSGPGELTMRGVSAIHTDDDSKRNTWDNVDFGYDLAAFWKSPDNPDLVFLEVAIERCSLLGPDFVRKVWKPIV